MPFDERELLALDVLVWTRLTVEPRELGFVVEEFELAWRTSEMDVDDILGARGEMRRVRREWIGSDRRVRRRGIATEKLRERDATKRKCCRASRERTEKCAPCRLGDGCGLRRVRVTGLCLRGICRLRCVHAWFTIA